jgi:3-methyladenine DNA glycosylase/8-oxoguanine DNA glycosylase
VKVGGEERVVHSCRPVDLGLTLGPLAHGGRRDPAVVIGPNGVWRATDTAAGPATVRLRSTGPTTVAARAWGPGAGAALCEVPALIGADDDPPPLAAAHPLVTELDKRMPGLRIGRTGAVLDAIVPTVLAQRVIGAEAAFAYVAMMRASGRSAPAAVGHDAVAPALLLPPAPAWLTATPYWAFHRWGVEQRRVATIKTAASHAVRLADAGRLPLGDARRMLFALPGVGPWTVNNVAMLALGDPDAVSVGDYWLKHVVCFALTGEPRGTDERMLELLEPWRGQRGRVCRLLLRGARRPPRFGPRLPLRLVAAH